MRYPFFLAVCLLFSKYAEGQTNVQAKQMRPYSHIKCFARYFYSHYNAAGNINVHHFTDYSFHSFFPENKGDVISRSYYSNVTSLFGEIS